MNALLPDRIGMQGPSDIVSRIDIWPHRPRIVLYSHGSVGLGHIRRNLLIAQTLSESPLQPTILVIAEAHQAGAFALPPRTDCLTLPALRKEPNGERRPRALDISTERLMTMRSNAIIATLESFEPDALIVDNIPRGAYRELDPVLEMFRATGRTRCILGLRDVLDDPAVIREEWGRADNEEAIRRYYDDVWVYGDASVYDMTYEYGFGPDVARKLRYAGYLDQTRRSAPLTGSPSDPLETLGLTEPFSLCTVGGGQDGEEVAVAFAQAICMSGRSGVIVTGPFMPEEARMQLHCYASKYPRLKVLEFVSEPMRLMQQAERVVTMGGYNTTCEVLSFDKQALLVPRVTPRREQMIRAERLRDMGLLDFLHPDAVTPRSIAAWLDKDLPQLPPVRDRIDLNGFDRLPCMLQDVLCPAQVAR